MLIAFFASDRQAKMAENDLAEKFYFTDAVLRNIIA